MSLNLIEEAIEKIAAYDDDPEYQRLVGEFHINRINHLRSFKQKMDAFTKSKAKPVEKTAYINPGTLMRAQKNLRSAALASPMAKSPRAQESLKLMKMGRNKKASEILSTNPKDVLKHNKPNYFGSRDVRLMSQPSNVGKLTNAITKKGL